MRIYETWNNVSWVEIKLEELPCSVHYIRIRDTDKDKLAPILVVEEINKETLKDA